MLFYGSCLRNGTSEGVLDFYVLVDSYRATYEGLALALGNALLPPNVFYLVTPNPDPQSGGPATLHCKYAVISLADFEHCVSATSIHSYIWARFAQPARLMYARDPEARGAVARCVTQAVLTFVHRLMVFLPANGRVQRFSMAALWQDALRRTYSAELRPESGDSARSIYEADSERYEAAGIAALETLQSRGWLERVTTRASAVEVEMKPVRRAAARARWRLTRPISKALGVLRLFKTAATFGDWLPYALWKLERHSGVQLELSERQQRHPLIFAWPVILRLISQRTLR